MFCDSVILSVQSYAFRVLEHDDPMHKRELICVSKKVSLILVVTFRLNRIHSACSGRQTVQVRVYVVSLVRTRCVLNEDLPQRAAANGN